MPERIIAKKRLSDFTNVSVENDPAVIGVSCDSRTVEHGYIFAALSGDKQDGLSYVDQAIQRGTVAILVDRDIQTAHDIPIIKVDNARLSYALMCKEIYGADIDTLYAVTGTSGKSSVVWFVRALLDRIQHVKGKKILRGASIGTMGIRAGGFFERSNLTSLEPSHLHQSLAKLAVEKTTDVALEASSHGLDQYRLEGLKFKAAAFTNLTHEHLDYHGTMEAYFEAKTRLFTELVVDGGTAVLNTDNPYYKRLKHICEKQKLNTVGYGRKATDYKLISTTPYKNNQRVEIEYEGQLYKFKLPLIGKFQVENVLCAIALIRSVHSEIALSDLLTHAETLRAVSGRLELVKNHPKEAQVYIDYAHKPDALKKVLKTVRRHSKGKLWLVFGCGGDRDKAKRPKMGEIAAEYADEVIITDDNPRSENPDQIRQEILAAAPAANNIGDRREAIAYAISHLEKGDALVIAGKGHEQGQIFQAQTLPFDDRDVARKEIKKLMESIE